MKAFISKEIVILLEYGIKKIQNVTKDIKKNNFGNKGDIQKFQHRSQFQRERIETMKEGK